LPALFPSTFLLLTPSAELIAWWLTKQKPVIWAPGYENFDPCSAKCASTCHFKEAACKHQVKQESRRNWAKNAQGALPGQADSLNRCGHVQCHVLGKIAAIPYRSGSLGDEQPCCQRVQCSCFHSDRNSTESKSRCG